MRFGIIYRHPYMRSKSLIVDADSLAAVKTMEIDLDPSRFYVDHLIDFESGTVHSVALTMEKRLMDVPEGDWGDLSRPEDFYDPQTFDMPELEIAEVEPE